MNGGPSPSPRLSVRIDGELMPEADARALWQRFSDHMEANRGDLAGFATKEGFASVHPGVEGGRPVLIVSRTAPQRPYVPASSSGSAPPQPGQGGGNRSGKKRRRGR